jgi:hypothetical protein
MDDRLNDCQAMHGIVEIDAKVGGDTFINVEKMTDLADKSRIW